jgi:hypothetical protein
VLVGLHGTDEIVPTLEESAFAITTVDASLSGCGALSDTEPDLVIVAAADAEQRALCTAARSVTDGVEDPGRRVVGTPPPHCAHQPTSSRCRFNRPRWPSDERVGERLGALSSGGVVG